MSAAVPLWRAARAAKKRRTVARSGPPGHRMAPGYRSSHLGMMCKYLPSIYGTMGIFCLYHINVCMIIIITIIAIIIMMYIYIIYIPACELYEMSVALKLP